MQSSEHMQLCYLCSMTTPEQQPEHAAQLDELPASFLARVVRTLDPRVRLALFQCSAGCMQAVGSSCEVRLKLMVGSSLSQLSGRRVLPRLLARLKQPNQQLHLVLESRRGRARLKHEQHIRLDQLLRVLSDGDSHAVPNTARVVKLSLLGFAEQLPQLLTQQFAVAFPNLATLSIHTNTRPTAAPPTTPAGMFLSTVILPNLTNLIITREPFREAALNNSPPANVYEHSWPSSQQLRAMLPNITSLELRDTTQPPLLIPAWSDQLTSLQISCTGLSDDYKHPALDQIETCHNLVQLSYQSRDDDTVLLHLSTWRNALDNLAVLHMEEYGMGDDEMELLLQLPQLVRVTVGRLYIDSDFSHKPCTWQYFNVTSSRVHLPDLVLLPLHSLTCPLHIGCSESEEIKLVLPQFPFPESKAIVQKLAQQLQHVGMSFTCRTLEYSFGHSQEGQRAASSTELAELFTAIAPCILPHCMAAGTMQTQWPFDSDGLVYADTASSNILQLCYMKVGPTLLTTLATQHKISVRQLALVGCTIEGSIDEFWASVLQFKLLHSVQLIYMYQGLNIDDEEQYEALVGTPMWTSCLNDLKLTCLAVKRQLTALQHRQSAASQLLRSTARAQQQSGVEASPKVCAVVADSSRMGPHGIGSVCNGVACQQPAASGGGGVRPDQQPTGSGQEAQHVAEVNQECQSDESRKASGGQGARATESAQEEVRGVIATPASTDHVPWRGMTIQLHPVPFPEAVLAQACHDTQEVGDLYRVCVHKELCDERFKGKGEAVCLAFLPVGRCL